MTAVDADRGFDPRWRGPLQGLAAALLGIMAYGALVVSRLDLKLAAHRRERETLQQTLRELKITRAKWGEFTAEDKELGERLNFLATLLPARPDGPALHSTLQALARRDSVDIGLVRIGNPGNVVRPHVQAVAVELQAAGTLPALVSFSGRLSNGAPVLKLTRLDIYPGGGRHRARIDLEMYLYLTDRRRP